VSSAALQVLSSASQPEVDDFLLPSNFLPEILQTKLFCMLLKRQFIR
jgi:hypothetical protein